MQLQFAILGTGSEDVTDSLTIESVASAMAKE